MFRFCLGRENTEKVPIDVCFTSDSAYLLSGSANNRVITWNVKTKRRETDLIGLREECITCIAANSHYTMLATGGADLTLWAPKSTELDDNDNANI